MSVASPARAEARSFSRRLWAALVVLVGLATALAVWLARAQLLAAETQSARLRFATESAAASALRAARAAELQHHLDRLATRPRLHAALEDDALDLLYPVALDELRDFFLPRGAAPTGGFHRFLDAAGHEIPPAGVPCGELPAGFAAELTAFRPTDRALWRLWIDPRDPDRAWEITAAPFFSHEDRRRLGALLIGAPLAAGDAVAYWSADRLHAPALPPAARADLVAALRRTPPVANEVRALDLAGVSQLLAFQPAAADAAAWEIRLAPLAPLQARQAALTRRIVAVGALVGLAGVLASGWISARFAVRFGRVAQRHDAQRRRRERVESRLEITQEERDRAARFAADASHQLKTPVAILRAGLDEFGAAADFPREREAELADLVRQTERLGHIVDDLLLLARLDAGLVPAIAAPVDLDDLLDRALDDASACPGAEQLVFARQGLHGARALGDARHYALALQSLLENAVKYSRPATTVHVSVLDGGETWIVCVDNVSAAPVPAELRERIFERFHRGPSAGSAAGYGLGLSLARLLARLHGGEVRLAGSDATRTRFELTLRKA
ncbi:MAG: sensor histidine kinase [Opitutae bacterium]|nr:sensor histidine kinase [Opitutae bacterium]